MLSAFLREPLLHFALAGAALFMAYAALSSGGPAPAPVAPAPDPRDTAIVVDAAIAGRLEQQFRAVWNRPPTPAEMDGLIDAFITEEILVREALALGLDADDAVVRQRLRLKMEFLLEAAGSSAEPTEDDLAAYLADNLGIFSEAPRMAFRQVFLGTDGAAAQAGAALEALRAGADPDTLGQPSLLPRRVPSSPPAAVDGTFGQGFFAAAETLPEGTWSGPVESGYGLHLVRVDRFQPGRLPPLEEIRDAVERGWRAAQAEAAKTARLQELREIYRVERTLPAAEGAP